MTRIKYAVETLLCNGAIGRLVSALTGDWVRSPAIPRNVPRVNVFAPKSIVPYQVRASLFWGFHEAQERRFVRSYLPADTDVIELGAGLGAVSALISQQIGADRRLISVEANPKLVALIQKTVSESGAQNFSVVNAAIDYSGARKTALDISDDVVSSQIGKRARGKRLEVPTIRLDEILRRFSVGEYALVCDIEGAEWDMFSHDSSSLDRCRLMIIEAHSAGDPTLGVSRFAGNMFRLLASRGAVSVYQRVSP